MVSGNAQAIKAAEDREQDGMTTVVNSHIVFVLVRSAL